MKRRAIFLTAMIVVIALIVMGFVGQGKKANNPNVSLEKRISALEAEIAELKVQLQGSRNLQVAKEGGVTPVEGEATSSSGGTNPKPKPLVWTEGQRGWAEDGVNMWTALGYNGVGIGVNPPAYKLDVAGTIQVTGFKMPTGAAANRIMVSDATGVGIWQDASTVPDADWTGAGTGKMYATYTSDTVLVGTTTPLAGEKAKFHAYNTGSEAGILAYTTDAGYVGLAAAHSSGPYGQFGGPSYGIFGRYDSNIYGWFAASTYGAYAQNTSSIYGYIATSNSGIQGSSNNTSGAGVLGDGSTVTDGVYGQTGASGTYFGIDGYNSNATGSGVLGLGSGNLNLAWSGSGDGVIGASDAGYGVIGAHYDGVNTNRWGCMGSSYYGVYGSSDNTSGAGVGGISSAASASAIGVYGSLSNTGTYDYSAVYGIDPNYSDWYGYGGRFYGGYMGVYGYNNYTGGTGYGVYGYAPSSGWAGYFSGDLGCSGAKPAVVRTSKGPTELYAMESPELWFEDFGSGQLVDGRTHIKLDKLFLETVTINNENPIKVFITLTGECNGVYVKKGKTGFDVVELNNGSSNATFDYRIIAKRKGYTDRRLALDEGGYIDPHLYPDPYDPEIPAKYREKRLAMENPPQLRMLTTNAVSTTPKISVQRTAEPKTTEPTKSVIEASEKSREVPKGKRKTSK